MRIVLNYLPGSKAIMLRNFIMLFATSLMFCLQSQALPSDRLQPIEIESDRAERNEKLGRTIYAGGVVITQGTIQIKADKVTVTNVGNKVARIVCVGKPAHYQQQPATDQGLIFARASTIEYLLDKNQISLIKNASLEQNGSTISGELIEYDLPKELVKAQGDLTGKQRIQMVIPPSAQQHEKIIEQVDAVPESPEPVEVTTEETPDLGEVDAAQAATNIDPQQPTEPVATDVQPAESDLVEQLQPNRPETPVEEVKPLTLEAEMTTDKLEQKAESEDEVAAPVIDSPQQEPR